MASGRHEETREADGLLVDTLVAEIMAPEAGPFCLLLPANSCTYSIGRKKKTVVRIIQSRRSRCHSEFLWLGSI